MIISHAHKYVYIGIPRTGSKSMNRWLMDHFQGEWFGGHHDWLVPENATDYLIFTVVRNPYDRAVSGYFGLTWDGLDQKEEFREKVPVPDKSTNSFTKVLEEATAAGNDMNQKPFVEKAGVSLVLYFERLPSALKALPFVDKNAVPEFPHVLERGIRPSGDFFDFFNEEDEAAVWTYSSGDFNTFGYKRFSCNLPTDAADSFQMSG